jgi:hypothetical protein
MVLSACAGRGCPEGRCSVIAEAWRRYKSGLDWVEELAYLTLLAMEASIIYPWQLLVNAWSGYDGIPFWGVCALLWVSYALASLLGHTELTADRKQVVIAVLLIFSVLVAVRVFVYPDYRIWQLGWVGDMANELFSFTRFPPDLIAIVVVFVAWWRGILAARKEYSTPNVWFHFRVGVILMFVYLFLTIFGHRGEPTSLLFAFFFFGLISIALARIMELGGIHASTLGSRRWIAVLLGATLGSLGLGLLVTVVFSRQTLRAVLGWFDPLLQLLSRIAWFAVAFVLYLLVPLFEWMMAWIPEALGENQEVLESLFGSPLVSPLEFPEVQDTPDYYPVCRTIFVVVLVVGGILLVARLIRKLVQQQAERDNLERESLFSSEELLNDLRNGLRERWDQLRALVSQVGDRRRRSIESILKIYASMVDLATEVGYPRREAETPYEYRSTLYRAFIDADEAIDAITEAYVRTHYGEVPDTRQEMAQIVRHWKSLQARVVPKPKQDDT